jgi:hypothetical protein
MKFRNYVSEVTKDLERNVNSPKDFDKALKTFVKLLQQRNNEWYKQYENLKPPEITYKKGGRYIKVIRKERTGVGTSVVAFVDTKEDPGYFGNIYKPAGWKAPAKGTRGNIFSTQNGMEAIGPMGSVIYFR